MRVWVGCGQMTEGFRFSMGEDETCATAGLRWPVARPTTECLRNMARLMVILAYSTIALNGCSRAETQPRNNASSEQSTKYELIPRRVPEIGQMQLPAGWTVSQSEYPSQYGSQPYHTVKASASRTDDEEGIISVDVSPSHPSLWRQPLGSHVNARMDGLRSIGPATSTRVSLNLDYEAVQYHATFGTRMNTTFRVFRQRSRVVTVAYTAGDTSYNARRAMHLVELVSGSLLLELPIVSFDTPDLKSLQPILLGDTLCALIPTGWNLHNQRDEATVVPAITFELIPDQYDRSDAPPILTLSLVMVSLLGGNLDIESVTTTPDGRTLPGDNSTAIQVDDDTLAVARVERLATGDVVTINYAAPDYIFEPKPALGLLEDIASYAHLADEQGQCITHPDHRPSRR